MKRALVIGVLLALVSAALWFLWPGTSSGGEAAAYVELPPDLDEVAQTEALASVEDPEEDPEQERSSVPEAQRQAPDSDMASTAAQSAALLPGRLKIEVRFADDGSAAPGEVVLLRRSTGFLHGRQDQAFFTDERGEILMEEVQAGPYFVRLLRGTQNSILIESGQTARLELEVQAGPDVHGIVVDENEFPIPAAQILMSEAYVPHRTQVVAFTDETGCFSLRSVRTGQHSIGARAPGRAPSHVELVVGEVGTQIELEFVLHASAGHLRGRVSDPEGLPVEGAVVLVGTEEPQAAERNETGGFSYGAAPQDTDTDEQGAFEMDSIAAGWMPLQVRARGFAPYRSEVEVMVGVNSNVEVTLVREARVTGIVRDGAGQPVPSVWVHTSVINRLATAMTHTRPDGSYELEGLPTGRVDLVAEDRELGRTTVELDLASGSTTEWNPVLVAEPRIHGILLDEEREPLAGWGVVAWEGSSGGMRARSDPTRADGSFSIRGLLNEDYVVFVHAPKRWMDFPRAIVRGVSPDPAPLEIIVEDPDRNCGRIVGEVLNASGEPAVGVDLNLWHVEQRLWRSFTTDGEGRFEIVAVPVGTVELELRPAESPWKKLGTHPIEAGELVDLETIQLDPASFVRGTIVGGEEAALESLRMILTRAGENGEAGVLTRTGREYRSNALSAGPYLLHVSGEGVVSATHPLEVPSGEELTHDLELEQAAVRRVVLEFEAGRELPRWVSVMVLDGTSGRSIWSRSLNPEHEQLEVRVSVVPGTHRVRATAEDGRKGEAAMEVLSFHGGQPPLRIPLR